MTKPTEQSVRGVPLEARIHELRGHNVMFDRDLASLYVVEAKALNHKDLSRRLNALEAKYDDHFKVVFEAIRQLMEPPPESARVIGFRTDDEE